MKKNSSGVRSDRVASEIKKVVSEFLIHGGLGGREEEVNPLMIVVTDVVVSSCLRHAKIFVSSISDELDGDVCANYLEKHSNRIRKVIGGSIKLKFVPEIKFLVDTSREQAKKIENILNRPGFSLR